jgi:hypothetical protein
VVLEQQRSDMGGEVARGAVSVTSSGDVAMVEDEQGCDSQPTLGAQCKTRACVCVLVQVQLVVHVHVSSGCVGGWVRVEAVRVTPSSRSKLTVKAPTDTHRPREWCRR